MKENDILSEYLQSLYGIEPLSVEEEHALSALIQAGDEEALDKLITHNLRFVVFVVRKMSAWNFGSVPIEDIIAMGNEAMFTAARRWIPKNNARFVTYAKPFIEKGVRRELDNTSNMIRMPVNIMEQIKRVSYNERALLQILGRTPTTAEIAKITGYSEAKVRQIQSYMIREPISLDSIDQEKKFSEEFYDD